MKELSKIIIDVRPRYGTAYIYCTYYIEIYLVGELFHSDILYSYLRILATYMLSSIDSTPLDNKANVCRYFMHLTYIILLNPNSVIEKRLNLYFESKSF